MIPARLRSRFALLSLLASLLFALYAEGQSTESVILARLQGQSLFLRGLYTDDKLKFDATGKPEKDYKTGSFTVCGFRADTVQISGDRLRISGVRLGLNFDKDGMPHSAPMTTGKFITKDEAVSIDIDNPGQTDFTQILDKVFASGFQELAPSLPDFWQPFLRRQRTGESIHFKAPKTPCSSEKEGSQSSIGTSSCGPGAPPVHIGGSVMPPKLLSSPDPKFSDAARKNRFSGNVEVYLVVGVDGLPTHIEIVRPVGLGLDEMAAAAVSQYRFRPATRDGQPVKVDLYVEVNFQIY